MSALFTKQKVPNPGFPGGTNKKISISKTFINRPETGFFALEIKWSGKRSGLSAICIKQKVPNAGFPRDTSSKNINFENFY